MKIDTALRMVTLPLRVYIGGIFLFACFHKILDPGDFALSIASYQFLPLGVINIFAVALPWVELAAGLGMIIGFRTRENSLLIAGMLLVFIVAISSALLRDLVISCGCFASSSAESEMSRATLIRDVVWLGITGFLFLFEDGAWGIDGVIERRKKRGAPDHGPG